MHRMSGKRADRIWRSADNLQEEPIELISGNNSGGYWGEGDNRPPNLCWSQVQSSSFPTNEKVQF